MFKKGIVITTIVAAFMLAVLLFTTNPQNTGPLGILGFFVFMYVAALGVLTFLFHGISVFFARAAFIKSRNINNKQLSLRQSYYRASVVALAPVMLIAMQSVGEVGVYQLLLVIFFIVVAWLYVTTRTA